MGHVMLATTAAVDGHGRAARGDTHDVAYNTRCPAESSLSGEFFHDSTSRPSVYVIMQAWL